MGQAQEQLAVTVAEYFRREAETAERHQLIDGEIFAMAGASAAHVSLCVNLTGELFQQLKGGPCRLKGSDQRLRVGEADYTYPDLTIVCGPGQSEPGTGDTLLNPRVIFEVLSDSTEAFDRGRKFELYRGIESLQTYVLVAQHRMHVECFERSEAGWVLSEYSDPDDLLPLPAANANLRLADLYADALEPPA